MKLKSTEIKSYREQQLKKQNGLCALCLEPIIDDAVLDHNHKTGLIRKVLHRGCNSLEGKIVNNLARSKIDLTQLTVFCKNLVSYITTEHTEIRHPTHLTKEERYEKLARKRIKNRKKQKETQATATR